MGMAVDEIRLPRSELRLAPPEWVRVRAHVGVLEDFLSPGAALTALLLHDALARGCQTASLQSTEIAEGVYAAVGFRDLGQIFEYVP